MTPRIATADQSSLLQLLSELEFRQRCLVGYVLDRLGPTPGWNLARYLAQRIPYVETFAGEKNSVNVWADAFGFCICFTDVE